MFEDRTQWSSFDGFELLEPGCVKGCSGIFRCVYNLVGGILTADAIDHKWVQLLLAVFALAGQVRHGLHLTVEQVVQQCQCHLLRRAAVTADVQHVALRHGAAHTHLWVIFIPEPRSCREILCTDTHEE